MFRDTDPGPTQSMRCRRRLDDTYFQHAPRRWSRRWRYGSWRSENAAEHAGMHAPKTSPHVQAPSLYMKCTYYKASVIGASLWLTAVRVMQTQRQDRRSKHKAAIAAWYWHGWLQCPKAWLRWYSQMMLSTLSTCVLTELHVHRYAEVRAPV